VIDILDVRRPARLVMARFALSAFLLIATGCQRATPSPPPTPIASAASAPPEPPPRFVFIDGGAHLGETVLAFEKSTLFTKHPWSIVSFEPNPELVPLIPKRPELTLHEEAIWTKDEDLDFRFAEEVTLGGSVVASVVKVPHMKTVKVHAIDFSQWLARTYRKDDVVYLKFDIEGAEYPVLHKMLRDGTMALIDRLYIEFHGEQQATAAKAKPWEIVDVKRGDNELIEAITGLAIPISLHQNEEPQGDYFNFNPEKYGQPW
jgi:FkbM family methyltransferase